MGVGWARLGGACYGGEGPHSQSGLKKLGRYVGMWVWGYMGVWW